ncbi:sigma factor [Plantactinospora soyae]|uniref:DNA-directed RNA polymerase specialized sigma24 family protein n=1 Tax=Plantactinospora soyae TaxID=1544732 RepID=A0A927M9X4_9ACTN|nr:sigma factor [Plantactinospora soyae]MBE1490644.1 DNA-directed RNA polymerase specialized sigma24 family protein [Plantactinospora soyae]
MLPEPRRPPRPATLPSAFCAVVAERRLLQNLAYRLLGSARVAEHAVRETYVRWYTMPDDEQGDIDSPVTWLVGTLVRICVDLLESSAPRVGGQTVDQAGCSRLASPSPRRWSAWRDVPKL